MTQPPESNRSELITNLRSLRTRYDGLRRGDIASLRRCRTAGDISLEGTFWRLAGALGHRVPHLSHVVVLFPAGAHAHRQTFSFGRFLHNQLGDSGGATLRFRRLIESRDRDELDHRLRGLLKLACADGGRVDWGFLGLDLLWFFAESGSVRRRWAQDFYAPTSISYPPRTTPPESPANR